MALALVGAVSETSAQIVFVNVDDLGKLRQKSLICEVHGVCCSIGYVRENRFVIC